MSFIKSMGDGVGTAAGVAWPTFGIVFASLSMSVAGMAALVIGSIATVLFLLVLVPVTVWSYTHYLEEMRALAIESKQQNDALVMNLAAYIQCLEEECAFDDPLFSNRPPQYQLKMIKSKVAEDGEKYKNEYAKRLIQNPNHDQIISLFMNRKGDKKFDSALAHISPTDTFAPLPFKYIKTGMMNFFAAFGSVAGCTAGTLGMLTGIGVIAGLAATPLIGWVALGAAVLFGLTVAGISAYSAYKKDKTIQQMNNYKNVNDNLVRITQLRQVKLETKMEMNSQPASQRLIQLCAKRKVAANNHYSSEHSIWKQPAASQTNLCEFNPITPKRTRSFS